MGDRKRERERSKLHSFCILTHPKHQQTNYDRQSVGSTFIFVVHHVIARRAWHSPCTKPLNKCFEERERGRERERPTSLL